jgi:hypothetical protein
VGLRTVYGNSDKSGYAMSFFSLAAVNAKEAFLASPFYSTYEPIEYLTKQKCKVNLLIRLCPITTPMALKKAINDPLVTIRYYTDPSFHAKLYIVDNYALVGSANLTNSGLQANREVSVVLQKDRDEGFEELPGLFSVFWDYADVLTQETLGRYEKVFSSWRSPPQDAEFTKQLSEYVDLCSPPTIRVGSEKITKRRAFLQGFKKKYDVVLVPAFNVVREEFSKDGRRRPEFIEGNLDVEISRYLGWLRVVHASLDTWADAEILDEEKSRQRIRDYLHLWHATDNVTNGDMIYADREVENIRKIRSVFANHDSIRSMSYDDIFDALTGCHAFHDLLRFTKGGLPGLHKEFLDRNSIVEIKKTLLHLSHGRAEPLVRAYDCIFDEQYKLQKFGESCVMELLGWLNDAWPPINGRTIKALRFLGFDVEAR